jgi:dihydroorotate dehydrogenase
MANGLYATFLRQLPPFKTFVTPKLLYSLAKPWLFALDPEKAHDLVFSNMTTAAKLGMLRIAAGPVVNDPIEILGLTFTNRVGLAAGLDKNGAYINALAQMGFGFVEIGTVTPLGQPGNPKPRMFRLPKAGALINRLGFNNEGLDSFLANVTKAKAAGFKGVLGLNIGKNLATPIENAIDDYLICLKGVYPHASYVAVNVSSPNTKNLRQLQGASELDAMLARLRKEQLVLAKKHKRYVPLLLKIAPDLDNDQISDIARLLKEHEIDGVIATNTTLSREAVKGMQHSDEAGGLSGQPVFEASNKVIAELRRLLPKPYPIIGVGGIASGKQAQAKIAAGADLVQIYTGLIYEGPGLVGECARALSIKSRF